MKILQQIHSNTVHSRRVESLLNHILPLLPKEGLVLDVGCGDGLLGSLLQSKAQGVEVKGLDVLIRENIKIPVISFDGKTIPFQDKSVDTVLLIDVLHHTSDPAVILREARRVARQAIIIKDHTRDGFLARSTLRFMDWVGNASYGVALPYNYLSSQEWDSLFAELDLKPSDWNGKLQIYPKPADYLFGRSLHFVARIKLS
ncbi:class I SAM-dependent methyltransferase [Gimesia sp.]|uniref:class I SAM-dependent methyltransferase n=1 Tax=Gimesia sp. TaxID=2024833 RepID=UPI000C40EF00|nr:class I SAM-dependent methyltransferase [Gimesia sp.]MAX35614.1 SAM-dependent methyltransferase [Gimesia sp.]HAH43850.1 SAM-dependent methyltransferase [Planctomycetaceae bacterium]|tara:strand:+ start:9569 stop:10171 length:603 start_codon:yes stop_codon:yes gene_type:complete